MNCYDYSATVQYADLGEDSRISPVSVLRMMQEAAARASAACGFGPLDGARRGVVWALCGWKLRLDRRCQWGSALTVRTWPRAVEAYTSDRDFLLLDSAGETAAAATSRWLLIDTATGRAAKITPEVRESYPLLDRRALEGEVPPANARGAGEAEEVFRYTVLRRDIDTLHHMNNLHYLELAREALPDGLGGLPFGNVEILYKRQLRLGETARFFYTFAEGKHLVELRGGDGRRTHAILWLY